MFLTIKKTIQINVPTASTKTNLADHTVILEFAIILRQKLYFSFLKKYILCFLYFSIYLLKIFKKIRNGYNHGSSG